MKDITPEIRKARRARKLPLTGLLGLLMLFVVASVAYSSYIVWFGTDGYIPKILIGPQMLFAGLILVQKFSK